MSNIYCCPNQIFDRSTGPESPRVGVAGEDDGDSRLHIMILIRVLLWNKINLGTFEDFLNNLLSLSEILPEM